MAKKIETKKKTVTAKTATKKPMAKTVVKTAAKTPAKPPVKAAVKKPTAKKSAAVKSSPQKTMFASRLVEAKIKELKDWRGTLLTRLRSLVHEADPNVTEELKWRGVPVWSHGGMICTGETYKNVVKMTFAKGASLKDPAGLFNSSLEGNTRRAIDFHEGSKVNEEALKALIQEAIALNTSDRSR